MEERGYIVHSEGQRACKYIKLSLFFFLHSLLKGEWVFLETGIGVGNST